MRCENQNLGQLVLLGKYRDMSSSGLLDLVLNQFLLVPHELRIVCIELDCFRQQS